MENAWRDRYYELERTLESIIGAVRLEMIKQENNSANSTPFKIAKLTRSNTLGAEFIHCVASGINLEFSFEFKKGDNSVHSVPFQRSNSVPVSLGTSKNATQCVVRVRENAGPEGKIELERKIEL